MTLPDAPLGVVVDEVSYAFDGFQVLDGVSFEVRPNEAVALVGSTGVGKSTLAQLLVRLDDPAHGSISFGGIDLRRAEPASLGGRLRSCPRRASFATSVGENISLDAEASRDEVEQAARIARADDFIRGLPDGYDTVVGERGHTLSGGERQRVALARALVRRPRVMILDDATSAVDPAIEAEILEGPSRDRHDPDRDRVPPTIDPSRRPRAVPRGRAPGRPAPTSTCSSPSAGTRAWSGVRTADTVSTRTDERSELAEGALVPAHLRARQVPRARADRARSAGPASRSPR